jgi:hypothetical protein
LFYAPFWAGPKIFSELKVVTVMLDSCTFPYIYSKIASALVPGMTPAFFRYACYALFTFGYFYLLVLFAQAAKKKERLILSMFSVFSLYILIGAFQLNAWHIVWVIPFILLSNMPARYELMLLLSFAAAISFWKRISFLLIAALLVYAFIVLISRKKGEPNAFSA